MQRIKAYYSAGCNLGVVGPRYIDPVTYNVYGQPVGGSRMPTSPHLPTEVAGVFRTEHGASELTAAKNWASPPTPDPKMGTASPQTDPAQAFKTDAGKVQFDLLEDGAPNALLEIAKVMSWAVEEKGYHPHSWQEIPDAIRRYKAALGRHRNAIARGEVLDPESKLLHWAHAACCVIFITELELRSKQP